MTEPMPLADLRDKVVIPACAVLSVLSGRNMASRDAIRMLLAITQQEDYRQQRRQQGQNGKPLPDYVGAYGLTQIERATVRLLQNHERIRNISAIGVLIASAQAEALCIEMTKPRGDVLSFILARLLLWCDPKPLPTTEAEGWACYAERVWRPGKPIRESWSRNWKLATEATEHL